MKKLLKLMLLMSITLTLGWGVSISTKHKIYNATEMVWIKLDDKPGNDKDWIGIYPKGSNSNWENVLAWKWAKNDSSENPTWYDFSILEVGEYEARFFLNDTFKTEKKVSFTITDKMLNISTWHKSYSTTETTWIKVDNNPDNEKSWIGIYPKGSKSDWKSVVAWKWAKDDSSDYPNWYDFSIVKAGEYEARFFLTDDFVVEKKVPFTITSGTVHVSTWHKSYKTTELAWIKLGNKPGNAEDWIGIYLKGSDSTEANIVAWKWAKDDSSDYPDWYNFSDLKAGRYEARFFLNNTYTLEGKVEFDVEDIILK